jgi:hypothetical protein
MKKWNCYFYESFFCSLQQSTRPTEFTIYVLVKHFRRGRDIFNIKLKFIEI